ncbi:hypothetical protein AB9M10_12650 [Rhodococcus erythropolis]
MAQDRFERVGVHHQHLVGATSGAQQKHHDVEGLQVAEPALLHGLCEQAAALGDLLHDIVFEDHVVCLDVGQAGLVLGAEERAVLEDQQRPAVRSPWPRATGGSDVRDPLRRRRHTRRMR